MIAIVEDGTGSAAAVARAVAAAGAEARPTADPAAIRAAASLVLPGVGSCGALMEALDRRGLRAPVVDFIASGRPFLGIGTGFEALYAGSDAAPAAAGLGIWPGRVRRFPRDCKPHVGWTRLQCRRPSRLLAGLGAEPWLYFAHAYFVPEDERTTYVAFHPEPFVAAAESGNVCGVQFHPQKSGRGGLAVLTNFLLLARGAPVASRNPHAPQRAPARRIIPCCVVDGGRTRTQDCGAEEAAGSDAAALAEACGRSGADELALRHRIPAAGHPALLAAVRRTARALTLPLGAGGGLGSVADAGKLLAAGADKVWVNTAAVTRPALLEDLARAFGSPALMAAITARPRPGGGWEVVTHGGRTATGIDAVGWAMEAEQRGAGEIVLTSIAADGVPRGVDCELTAAVAAAATIPVIAAVTGAAECIAALTRGRADAVLMAPLRRPGDITGLKRAVAAAGVPVRGA